MWRRFFDDQSSGASPLLTLALFSREFLSPLLVAVAVTIAAVTTAAAQGDGTSDEKPNVVMIVADDQSFRDFGFLGNDVVHTPHIDRLAARSARYPNGYVPMSVCRPSLATMLTGLYPHQHGIHFNHPPPGYSRMREMTAEQYHATRATTDRFIEHVSTIPGILSRHGYASLQTGKFWEGHYANAGFTHGMTTGRPTERLSPVTGTRQQRNGEWVAHGNGDAGLVIGRETMQPIFRFMEEQAGRQPFFVWYSPLLPHDPYDAAAEYERLALEKGTPPHLAAYYASIARFDRTVGELLEFLEAKNLLDTTLIIFVTDNGHRPDPARPTYPDVRAKLSQYEDGVRTPVLLRWDGRIEAGEHLAPVETIDLLPTILSAAGLSREITSRMQGRNLLPSAMGLEDLALTPVFGAIYPNDAATLGRPSRHVRGRWVRHGDFKLILPGSGPNPLPLALYDLSRDPGETTNLARSPEHAERIVRMTRLMDRWWPATWDHVAGHLIVHALVETFGSEDPAFRLEGGGMVTVEATGHINAGQGVAVLNEATGGTGDLSVIVAGLVDGDVLHRGRGNLDVLVAGRISGDVEGLGGGAHLVTVAPRGGITGTIRLGGARNEVRVDGATGRILYGKGGTATIAATGEVTGIGGEAIRSDAGDLDVTVAGMVTGDIEGRGDGEHRVTVEKSGRVAGTIRLAGAESAVTVAGTARDVALGQGGLVSVGEEGRLGADARGVAVESGSGALRVVLQAARGESAREAAKRLGGRMVEAGGEPEVVFRRTGEEARVLGRAGSKDSLPEGYVVPDGAYDLGVDTAPEGGVRFREGIAPRSRVYEALAPVLLGMNGLTGRQERREAPRNGRGAWARVESRHVGWTAARASMAGELEYDLHRHGVQAGVEAPLPYGEDVAVGVSLHHRQGTADVVRGGKLEVSGAGVGVSGTWRGGKAYLDVQGSTTWYETGMRSATRGKLKEGVSGFGYALGVEAGRRLGSGPVGDLGEVTVTPRMGLERSGVTLQDFRDAVDAQVSLGRAESLRGRVGMLAEVRRKRSRWFGSVDVEREFLEDEQRVRVSGTELATASEKRWLRLSAGGVQEWGDGRYALRGILGYAMSGRDNHELGGGLNLQMRF